MPKSIYGPCSICGEIDLLGSHLCKPKPVADGQDYDSFLADYAALQTNARNLCGYALALACNNPPTPEFMVGFWERVARVMDIVEPGMVHLVPGCNDQQ